MYKNESVAVKETKIPGSLTVFFKAVFASVLFTAAVFLVFSLLVCFTPLSCECIPFVSLFVMVLSVLLCASIVCRNAKSRGYLKGALAGLSYVFIIYLVSALWGGGLFFNAYSLLLVFLGIFVGSIGGILGINMKDRRRR